MPSFAIALIASSVAASCSDYQDPVRPPVNFSVTVDSVLTASADVYVHEGFPNANTGSAAVMVLKGSRYARPLVRFDQVQIAAAIGADSLHQAILQLTVSTMANNWGPSGRAVDLHRVTSSWTEAGATWNCAVDANTGNESPDCSGATAWTMPTGSGNPWAMTPTATTTITNGMTGATISLNDTADVRSFLTGTANFGWLLKKANDVEEGRIEFGSRESSIKPRLVLTIVRGDTSRPVIPATFTMPQDSTGMGLLQDPIDTVRLVIPDMLVISIDDSTSGPTVRNLFAQFGVQVVGGFPDLNEYYVKIPAPGSIAQLDSVAAQIDLVPGIRYAIPIDWQQRIKLDGRFPNEGAGAQRAAWFSTVYSTHASPRLAVRAPHAWSCENGQYGSGPGIRVGVVDYLFRDAHPDLPIAVVPADTMVTGARPLPTVGVAHHGMGVAGILAASGDNNTGVTGMVWNSQLVGYQLARGSRAIRNLTYYLKIVVLPHARTSGVKVLVLSLFSFSQGVAAATDLEFAMRKFIQNGGLIVISAGNDTITTLDRAAVAALPQTNPSQPYSSLRVAAARIAASPDSGGILVVSATDASFAHRRLDANSIPGLTFLAAPGDSILTLANDSASGGSLTGIFGNTSAAAPFVGGAAALLWQFDSTLSNTQVRSYLVRGSRAQRLSNQTGQLVDPPDINGLPGAKLLDIYGALALASAERPGTPVCGFPVRLGGSSNGYVVLERPVAPDSFFPGIQPFTNLRGVSVAQGGRLITAWHDSMGTGIGNMSITMTHRGTLSPRLFGALLAYLEKDTVYLRWDTTGGREVQTVEIRRADGTKLGPLNPFSGMSAYFGFVEVNPAGTEMALRVYRNCGMGCAEWLGYRMQLPSGSPVQLISELELGDDIHVSLHSAWSSDGRVLAFSPWHSSIH